MSPMSGDGAAIFVCGHLRPSILKEKDYWASNNKGFYVQGIAIV